MLNKFLAATALSLTLGAAGAIAQTAAPGGGTPGQAGTGAPAEWEGNIGGAFYSDSAAGTLFSDDEIRANWGTLSPDDQIAVRNYCARMGMDAADQERQTEQMADGGAAEGQAAGVTSLQAEDQAGETEQMADGGAIEGQVSGVPTDEATDQQQQTQQMGGGTAVPGGPSLHASHDESVARVCDIIETM